MNLQKATQGYLLCKSAEGVRERTLESYRYHLRLLIEFLGECDVESVTTLADVEMSRIVDDCDQAHACLKEVLQSDQAQRSAGNP